MLNTDAYNQGARAAWDDDEQDDASEFHDNPYPEGSGSHKDWADGYAAASREIRSKYI